jgi:hypothetical protein
MGELEYLVLLSVIRLGSASYGMPIVDDLRRHTRRTILQPSVYLALKRLEDKRLVRSRLGEPRLIAIRLGADVLARFRKEAKRRDVTATDARTYIGVTVVVLAAAALATWWPARRASRVDPASTLRTE